MRNSCLAGLLVCLSLQVCSATSIMYVVTPAGIVIGADGRTLFQSTPGTALKIFLLKHRLVLASRNAESAKTKDGRATLYDFPTWTKVIDHRASANTTVEELSRIVEDEGPS